MKKKVAILDDYNYYSKKSGHLKPLQEIATLHIYHEPLNENQLIENLKEIEGIILWRERTALTQRVLQGLKQLKVIVQTGYSWAHLHLETIRKNNITLVATPYPPYREHPTAEFTIALLLSLAHRISYGDLKMKEEPWPNLLTTIVSGKKLGIIGYGIIGKTVARKATALGLDVLVWSRSLNKYDLLEPRIQSVPLEELLKTSDFISLHLRLSDDTMGFLNEERLSLMKKSAYLINTSRGHLIHEGALLEKLEKKEIAGAALDVFQEEPLPLKHPFRKLDNLILTPHIGWTSDVIQGQLLKDAANNMIAFFHGRPINVIESNRPRR